MERWTKDPQQASGRGETLAVDKCVHSVGLCDQQGHTNQNHSMIPFLTSRLAKLRNLTTPGDDKGREKQSP